MRRPPRTEGDPRVDHREEQVDEEVHRHEQGHDDQGDRLYGREVLGAGGEFEELADPSDAERGLHEDRADEQGRDDQAAGGEHGAEGVAQHMAADDVPFGHTAAAGDGDVFAVEGFEHGRAGDPGEHADQVEREGDGREGEMPQGVEEAVAGAAAGEPAELDGEQPLEQDGGDERRCADGDRGADQDGRVGGTAPYSGDPAEEQAGGDDHGQCHGDQQQGGGQAVREEAGDVRTVGEGAPEVALDHVAEPAEVADGEGGVQVVLRVDRDEGFGRGGPAGEQEARRGAGGQVHGAEHDERGDEQRGDHLRHAPRGESQEVHGAAPTSAAHGW